MSAKSPGSKECIACSTKNKQLLMFQSNVLYQLIQRSYRHLNLKWAATLNKHRKDNEMSQLINIRSFSLHVIHSTVKTAIESITWKIRKTLKSCWKILHESPARHQDYETILTLQVQHNTSFCFLQQGGLKVNLSQIVLLKSG